jgi:hypothetical protein
MVKYTIVIIIGILMVSCIQTEQQNPILNYSLNTIENAIPFAEGVISTK